MTVFEPQTLRSFFSKCWHLTEVLFFIVSITYTIFFTWHRVLYIYWISHHPLSSFPLEIHFQSAGLHFFELGNLNRWANLSAGQSCMLGNLSLGRNHEKLTLTKLPRTKLPGVKLPGVKLWLFVMDECRLIALSLPKFEVCDSTWSYVPRRIVILQTLLFYFWEFSKINGKARDWNLNLEHRLTQLSDTG